MRSYGKDYFIYTEVNAKESKELQKNMYIKTVI